MDYIKLSKEMSYALRHKPEEYGLELDEEGWVEIESLLSAFRKEEIWKNISQDDLKKAMDQSNKKRHEIQSGKIRALYGHSTSKNIVKEATKPPVTLYHGTAQGFLPLIMEKGLLPMERQYVHLSEKEDVARMVGKRRDAHPAILRIKAREAYDAGIRFFHGNEDIWLADPIPSCYIENIDKTK